MSEFNCHPCRSSKLLVDPLDDGIRPLVECPVCLDIMSDAVMCPSGQHPIGALCRKSLDKCPICGDVGEPIPARYCRDFIRLRKSRCAFECGYNGTIEETLSHEAACKRGDSSQKRQESVADNPAQSRKRTKLEFNNDDISSSHPEATPNTHSSLKFDKSGSTAKATYIKGLLEAKNARTAEAIATVVGSQSEAEDSADKQINSSVSINLELPKPWVSYVATAENCGGGEPGDVYYYNPKTEEVTWDFPAGCVETSDEKRVDQGVKAESNNSKSNKDVNNETKQSIKSELSEEKKKMIELKKKRAQMLKAVNATKAARAQKTKLAEQHLSRMGLFKKKVIKDKTTGSQGSTQQAETSQVLPEKKLTAQQKQVVSAAIKGENIFITGPAGVGKSFLVSHVIDTLTSMNRKVALTASTGVAAVNIKGMTIYAWSGIGIGREPAHQLVDGINKFRSKKDSPYARWNEHDVLVIDEVSMLSAEIFTKLDYIARHVRMRRREVFGGMQIIVVGDFFQLPPVPARRSNVSCPGCGSQVKQYIQPNTDDSEGLMVCHVDPNKTGGGKDQNCGLRYCRLTKLAFQEGSIGEQTWKKCKFVFKELTEVFRQKDLAFVELLARVRLSETIPEDWEELEKCRAPLDIKDGILPTKLYPTNISVFNENKKNYDEIDAAEYKFAAMDRHNHTSNLRLESKTLLEKLKKDTPYQENLKLKIGTQVILLKNISVDRGLCNGARGVVVDFVDYVDALDEQTLDEMDLDEKAFLQYNRYLPVCSFAVSQTNYVNETIRPSTWAASRVLDWTSTARAMRVQLPLNWAWAMTIHKSQGMTISKLEVHLNKAFAPGQAYVALSRATGFEGLELSAFDRSTIMADPQVLEFYKKHQSDTVDSIPSDALTLEKVESQEEKLERLQNAAKANGNFVDLTAASDSDDETLVSETPVATKNSETFKIKEEGSRTASGWVKLD